MVEPPPRPSPDPFHLAGTVLAEQFEVERYVAEGGFGAVYFARQRPFGRPVALKVLKLPEEMGPRTRRRVAEAFLTEGRITANLDLPGIAQVLSGGVLQHPDGARHPWLALQWIDGPTLKTWLAQRARHAPGAFTPRDALALLRPVFVTIGRAHREHRVAHRDVKPGNVMVVERGGHRDLYVVDFGIAKSMEVGEYADGAATRGGGVGCSLQYAAPEQLARHRSGPWTDVHALGLMLTELLTGGPAYRSPGPAGLATDVTSPQRPTPASLGVDVGAWEPVLRRALALNPRERHADALEFLAALEQTGVGAGPDALPAGVHPGSTRDRGDTAPDQERARTLPEPTLPLPDTTLPLPDDADGTKWRST